MTACGERSLQSGTRSSFSFWSGKVWTLSLLIIGKILCWCCIFLSELFLHFQANLLVLHCLGTLMTLLAPSLTYPHNVPFDLQPSSPLLRFPHCPLFCYLFAKHAHSVLPFIKQDINKSSFTMGLFLWRSQCRRARTQC